MNGGNSSTMKENANPVVHQVAKEFDGRRRRQRLQQSIGWSELQRWNRLACTKDQVDDDLNAFSTLSLFPGGLATAVDRSIVHALVDFQTSKDASSTDILDAATGVRVPSSASSLPSLREPAFHFVDDDNASHRWQENDEWVSLDNTGTAATATVQVDEVFDIIRNIQDPEHPLTLEQLNVVNYRHIQVWNEGAVLDDHNKHTHAVKRVEVRFTPTIPHCSMATLIGLCIRVKLLRSLDRSYKVQVKIQPGTHASEHAINKQLADKERVCAALENPHLLGVVNKCIAGGMNMTNDASN